MVQLCGKSGVGGGGGGGGDTSVVILRSKTDQSGGESGNVTPVSKITQL